MMADPVKSVYNVCGLACILGLTGSNNQVSLTTLRRPFRLTMANSVICRAASLAPDVDTEASARANTWLTEVDQHHERAESTAAILQSQGFTCVH